MGTGTAAFGKKGRGTVHIMCRRCGQRSMHKKTGICSSCGFGKTARKRSFGWNKKNTAN
ncbi:MAG: 50S ribosomal protein L37e [Candidatus Woesearchaeota archaeon]